MARSVPRHDRDAGGPAEVLAAKAALRQEVWSEMSAARVARFPGAAGRIPNFAGAEAAAERLRATGVWQAAGTVKANPDSAQLPVRQRALEDGKTVYMAVPRLAEPEPFFALDPAHNTAVVRPPRGPGGEVEVRDGCASDPIAVAPVPPAGGPTTVTLDLPPRVGAHDLCVVFTSASFDPMLALDHIELAPRGAP